MQWLGRILTAVFVLVVALVVLVFVLENQNSVSLAFLGWHTPDGPLSLFVSLAFILGGLGGLLSGALLRLRGGVDKNLFALNQPLYKFVPSELIACQLRSGSLLAEKGCCRRVVTSRGRYPLACLTPFFCCGH